MPMMPEFGRVKRQAPAPGSANCSTAIDWVIAFLNDPFNDVAIEYINNQ